MCHVCGFICYLCVQLKLKINRKSLSNQALKSAYPFAAQLPLLAFRIIQLMTGEPRPLYSALQLLGESGACGIHDDWEKQV